MSVSANRKYKIILVGDVGVGKTSLILRYSDNCFADSDSMVRLPVDCKDVTREYHGKKFNLQIWDTAGQEAYQTLTSNFFRDADGVFLVYDICNLMSFQNVKTWHEEIKRLGLLVNHQIVVGNKSDMEGNREVSLTIAEERARELGPYTLVETSAKTAANVDLMFAKMAELFLAQSGSAVKSKSLKVDTIGRTEGIDKCPC